MLVGNHTTPDHSPFPLSQISVPFLFLSSNPSNSLSLYPYFQLMTFPPAPLRNSSSKQATYFWTIYSTSSIIVHKLSVLLSKANLSTCAWTPSLLVCSRSWLSLSPTSLTVLYFSQFSHAQANVLIFLPFYKIPSGPTSSNHSPISFLSFKSTKLLEKMSPVFSSHSLLLQVVSYLIIT